MNEQEQEILNDPIAAKIHHLVQTEWTKVDSIYHSIRNEHWKDDNNSASLQNFNNSYNDDDSIDNNLEDGLTVLKESLRLARYQFNKNDDDDMKNNKTYEDDETERTKIITDTSFDIYDDNYNEEFVFATTKKPLPKIKSDLHKYGVSTPWIKQTRKLDTSDKNIFCDCPS